jgi:D-sedoheptulose 7-phosphate isomerase
MMAKLDEIRKSFHDAAEVLQKFTSDENNFLLFEKAADIMIESLQNGGKILSCGNGGSMCDAMHFAEELTGRFRDERPALAAIAMSDPSHLTCVGNDYGFDYVFSRYLEAIGNECDVLLAISTSGNSSNIIQAAMKAREKGMKIVSLTGKSGGKLASLSDVELRVPFNGYSDRVQEIHIKIIHTLIQYIEMGMKD